jgi:pimeloyl-ACP methyl ester carboxylesterase
VSDYNSAVASIARQIDGETPDELRSQLASVGVSLDQPKVKLPLARYRVAPRIRLSNEPGEIGIPMLLDYDTSNAPSYPRDGLIVSATAVYRHLDGRRHLSLLTSTNLITLKGSTYSLNIDNVAPVTEMARRGRYVAQSGLRNMLRPGSMHEKPGIFLTEPYDPKKVIVLVVPGLQSTPFAFVDLLKTMRADPQISAHFQVWTFLYATGTPVLLNALELRQELEKTIRAVDPHDHDFATRHIVVLGHSMGGLMAHTLVSSSGNRVWASVFAVPPQQLTGDRQTIRQIKDALMFGHNPRVVRAVFLATPHRGSNMAESWIGHMAESLIRLPTSQQNAFVEVAAENPRAPTPEAAAFGKGFNFTSVRALSPKEPALRALAELPINVPFHSIIGQHNQGTIEASSDGVVPYTSSHLNAATSELVVRSGHSICGNHDAESEVIRILRLELNGKGRTEGAVPLAGR